MCNKQFQASLTEVKRGNGKFCSKECSLKNTINKAKARATNQKLPNVICAYCDIPFYKRQSALKNSKSGLYFCCREHKDLSQRIGGIPEIQPPHYGTSGVNGASVNTYRALAFKSFPHKCLLCGYDKFPQILEVHHKDRDRTNNELSNLELLCPTCHEVHHFQTKTGKYGKNNG